MFIERLSDEEIKSFVKQYVKNDWTGEYRALNRYGDEASLFITIYGGALRSVCINDYNISTDLEYVDRDEIGSLWKKFMYEKFGDEYKQAFNENLRKEYESEMIK